MNEEKPKSTRAHKRGKLKGESTTSGSKLKVVLDYLEGNRDQRLVAAHYGLSQSTLCFWIKAYLKDKDSFMGKEAKKKDSAAIDSAKELALLRKQLEDERLKNIALQELIKVAEQEFNIPIAKKPGAKQ